MTYWNIDSMHGNSLSQGIQFEEQARRIAQETANRLGESVYLYEVGAGDGESEVESEEIKPEAAEPESADVQRAAKHIGATELDGDRWAHYAQETRTWWVVTTDELAKLCEYLDNDDEEISRDAYSHWCAGVAGKEMPRGWSPEGDYVIVETMPEQHRASHEAAGNWGSYPSNGAVRQVMLRADAESVCEDDDYNHIIGDADADDAREYGVEVQS